MMPQFPNLILMPLCHLPERRHLNFTISGWAHLRNLKEKLPQTHWCLFLGLMVTSQEERMIVVRLPGATGPRWLVCGRLHCDWLILSMQTGWMTVRIIYMTMAYKGGKKYVDTSITTNNHHMYNVCIFVITSSGEWQQQIFLSRALVWK